MPRTLLALLLISLPFATQAADPVAGTDYELLPPLAAPPSAKTAVRVAYIFSLQCHTCANTHERMTRWFKSLPADVVVIKAVASIVGQGSQEPTDETYQTLVNLGVADKAEPLIYKHLAKGKGRFQDRAALVAWLAKQGVAVESFDKTASSFRVGMQVSQSRAALSRAAKAESSGIPMMMVDNRYVVAMWNGDELPQQLATIDYLVAKSRAERAAEVNGTPATK